MSETNDTIIDLYDHFRDKRAESLVRHIEIGVRTDNISWSKKKRKEYDDRKKQGKAQ